MLFEVYSRVYSQYLSVYSHDLSVDSHDFVHDFWRDRKVRKGGLAEAARTALLRIGYA